MKNKLTSYDRLAKVIEDAVVTGSGYAASEAANTVDKEFILIPKSDLPAVVSKKQGWGNLDVMMARSAGYRGRDPKVYWERAFDFISVALYAEQEEVKQADRELTGKREEAYRMLYPKSALMWAYEDVSDTTKKQIDVVVNLMTQVDELKEAK